MVLITIEECLVRIVALALRESSFEDAELPCLVPSADGVGVVGSRAGGMYRKVLIFFLVVAFIVPAGECANASNHTGMRSFFRPRLMC